MKNLILVSSFVLSFTAVSADSLSLAFKNCLNENVSNSSIQFEKSSVGNDGVATDESIVAINCENTSAKALYQEVKRFSKETKSTFMFEGYQVVQTTRYFGTLDIPSQCSEFNVAEGSQVVYSCGVILDLNTQLTKALNF